MFEDRVICLPRIIRTVMKKQLWFKRKTYGWGWVPVTWQGWLVILVWAGIFALTILGFDHEWLKNTVLALILVIMLIGICVVKGEKPRWQWGKRR